MARTEDIKDYEIHGRFLVTHNSNARTYSFYSRKDKRVPIVTVDDGEFKKTLSELETSEG